MIDNYDMFAETTYDCSGNCGHCFNESSIGRTESLDPYRLISLVRHLVPETYERPYLRQMILSGGDGLLWKGLETFLDFALDYLDLEKTEIFVRTSGIPFLSPKHAERVQELAKYSEMVSIRLPFTDKYHPQYKNREIKKKAKNLGWSTENWVWRIRGPSQVVLLGRARNLSEEHWDVFPKSYCRSRSKLASTIHVNINGDINYCCWFPEQEIAPLEKVLSMERSEALDFLAHPQEGTMMGYLTEDLPGLFKAADQLGLYTQYPNNCSRCANIMLDHDAMKQIFEFMQRNTPEK